jgi:hypothetical protein
MKFETTYLVKVLIGFINSAYLERVQSHLVFWLYIQKLQHMVSIHFVHFVFDVISRILVQLFCMILLPALPLVMFISPIIIMG